MDLVDLRLVLNTARTTSLTAGGRDTFLSLPAASLRLKALEGELGLKLFLRQPHGMALTEEGRYFVEHAGKVLSAMEGLKQGLAALRQPERRTLRVAASSSYLTELLPAIVRSYLATHPDLSIDLHAAGRPAIESDLMAGRIDIGFLSSPNTHFTTAPIEFGADPLVMVAAADTALAAPASVDVRTLAAQPMVMLGDGGTLRSYLVDRLAEDGLTMNVRVSVESYGDMLDMVAAGIGVGVAHASVVRRQGGDAVRIVPIEAAWAQHRRYALLADAACASHHVTDFLAYVVEHWRRHMEPA